MSNWILESIYRVPCNTLASDRWRAIWQSAFAIGILLSLLTCQSLEPDRTPPDASLSEIDRDAPSVAVEQAIPPSLPSPSSAVAASDPVTTDETPIEEEDQNRSPINQEEVSDSERLAPEEVSDSERLAPEEFSDSERLEPEEVSDSERLAPEEVSDSERLAPEEVSDSERLEPEEAIVLLDTASVEEPLSISPERSAEEIPVTEETVALLEEPEPSIIQNDLLTEEQQARVAALQESGYSQEALALLQESVTASADNPPLNRSVALLAETLEEYDIATNFWEANLEAPSPYDREARAALLRNAIAQEDIAAALIAAREMFVQGEIPPIEELLYLAETSLQNEQYDEATRWYTTARQQYPAISQRDRLLWGLGQLEEYNPALRNMSQALDYYAEIVEQYPLSEYWEMARARSIYIRRHFFDVR